VERTTSACCSGGENGEQDAVTAFIFQYFRLATFKNSHQEQRQNTYKAMATDRKEKKDAMHRKKKH